MNPGMQAPRSTTDAKTTAGNANPASPAGDDANDAALVRLRHLFRHRGDTPADQALYQALASYRMERAE